MPSVDSGATDCHRGGHRPGFSGLGVAVVGISSDDIESHQKFRSKHDLPFVLLSDPDLEVAKLYGCKGALGMKRAVFLVDEKGIIRYAHIEALALFRRRAAELLEAIKALDEDGCCEEKC